jgi:predicted PurR-regulated permease PerM
MVPYLQIVGLIPAFLLAIVGSVAQGDPWWQLLLFTGIVFACVQTLQDTVLVPKIMGRVTGLSPAMILLSLSIWGRLLGLFGVLIALPMTCLLLAYYRRFISPVDEVLSAPAEEAKAAADPPR